MKISFPYMGCVTGYKKVMELLGHEVIMPEKPSQRTVDLGVLNSPEFICYPFKIIMGTYIELCEKGVEVIVASGGSGPCRAGMYNEIHRRVLRQLGYSTEIVVFDSIFQNFGEFLRKLRLIKNGTPMHRVLKYVFFAYKMISQMDELEKKLKLLRAYEVNRGDFDHAWEKIVALHDGCMKLSDLKQAKEKSEALLSGVEIRQADEGSRLRIGVVGEIYVIMESSTNMEIEKRLNALGAEVTNVQCISDWVRHNIIPRAFNKSKSWKVFEMGKEYKECACGGHDMENTGWIAEFAREGYDGIVHLMPFGCLPELVTKSLIPEMSEELGMPILSVSLDEQMGEANLQTRLEAFVDLCRSNKTSASASGGLSEKKTHTHKKHECIHA